MYRPWSSAKCVSHLGNLLSSLVLQLGTSLFLNSQTSFMGLVYISLFRYASPTSAPSIPSTPSWTLWLKWPLHSGPEKAREQSVSAARAPVPGDWGVAHRNGLRCRKRQPRGGSCWRPRSPHRLAGLSMMDSRAPCPPPVLVVSDVTVCRESLVCVMRED